MVDVMKTAEFLGLAMLALMVSILVLVVSWVLP